MNDKTQVKLFKYAVCATIALCVITLSAMCYMACKNPNGKTASPSKLPLVVYSVLSANMLLGK